MLDVQEDLLRHHQEIIYVPQREEKDRKSIRTVLQQSQNINKENMRELWGKVERRI